MENLNDLLACELVLGFLFLVVCGIVCFFLCRLMLAIAKFFEAKARIMRHDLALNNYKEDD
jgi:hypothetical protein